MVAVDLFYPFKTCIQCREQHKQYRERLKRQQEREADPDQLTFKKVLTENPDLDDIPLVTIDCFTFRSMCIGETAKDRLFYGFHAQSCRPCSRFRVLFLEGFPHGFNLWLSDEGRKETDGERRTRELDHLLARELL